MNNSVHIFLNNLPIILRSKREKMDFSQNELAQKISTSLRTYQRIESRESEPTLSQVYKLSQVLNFKMGDIFHFEKHLTNEIKFLPQPANELEQLAWLTNNGSWHVNLMTNHYHWSKTIKDILEIESDYAPNEKLAFSFFKPDHNLELARKSLDDCIAKAISFQIQAELITAKGNSRHVIITGVPEIHEGKTVGIHGAFQDNTKAHLIQEKLIQSVQDMCDIQSFAGFGHWKFEIATNHLEWSPSLYLIFEIDPKNIITNYEAFLDLVHPEDRLMVDTKFKESILNKKAYEIEHRILLPDGRIKWVLESCKYDLDQEGALLRTFGYTLDITNLKK